jgi:hypothetical protein
VSAEHLVLALCAQGDGRTALWDDLAMTAFPSGPWIALVVTGALAAGCGSGSTSGNGRGSAQTASSTPNASSRSQTVPTPAPTGVPADPSAVRVIRAWADALRVGDVRGAARYFALPSQFINGPDSHGRIPVFEMRTLSQAELVNASLPCGAQFISADKRGRYVNALFRLTDRPGPGGGCGPGAGQLARTNFVIVGGRIVQWIRAPDDPGDHGQGTPQRPPALSTPNSSSPVA